MAKTEIDIKQLKKQVSPSTSHEELSEEWFLVDAKGKRIGVLASKVAELLLGKHNPLTRDYLVPKTKIVVLNAEKIDATENRKENKKYKSYSGYSSGLREETLGSVLERRPIKAVEHAIKGMLPKNRRGRKIFSNNLYVYPGAEHKHDAQNPNKIEL